MVTRSGEREKWSEVQMDDDGGDIVEHGLRSVGWSGVRRLVRALPSSFGEKTIDGALASVSAYLDPVSAVRRPPSAICHLPSAPSRSIPAQDRPARSIAGASEAVCAG